MGTSARARGRRDAQHYLAEPGRLRELPLSRWSEGPAVLRMIRAAALIMPSAAWLAAVVGRVARARGRAGIAARADDIAYWAGVRDTLCRDEWFRLRGAGVPILLYHRVPPHPDRLDPKYALSQGRFAAQVRLLVRLGYRSIPLGLLAELHRAGLPPPPRSVVFTFDDGYADNHVAAAILRRWGFVATIFLVTGDVGGPARWRVAEIGQVPLLTWREVRELARAGVEFGAHSITHPRLAEMPAEEAEREIVASGEALQRECGPGELLFAYPHGSATPETRRLASQSGYLAACGTTRGLSSLHDDPWSLRRIQIYGDERLSAFCLRLLLGDNPLDYLPWGRLGRWGGPR